MTDALKEVTDIAGSQAGWAIALLTATWGIVLRALIGKHLRATEAAAKESALVLERLQAIELRLAVIESRSHRIRVSDRR